MGGRLIGWVDSCGFRVGGIASADFFRLGSLRVVPLGDGGAWSRCGLACFNLDDRPRKNMYTRSTSLGVPIGCGGRRPVDIKRSMAG